MNLLKEKQIGHKTVYYGFSIGAYMLMDLATKIQLDKIVLVSPSPLFADTIKIIPEEDRKDFDLTLFDKTLKEMCSMITCEVEVYVGEDEVDSMIKTAHSVARELGVLLNVVKGNHTQKMFNEVFSIESGT